MRAKRVLLFLILPAALIAAPSSWLVREIRNEPSGTKVLSGLTHPAQVATDGLGVPTVSASDRYDAMRVLGYLHARDRLFQMDLMRRKSAGRLAEIFGTAALEVDKHQRVYGFEQAARRILATLPKDQVQLLTDYADGVNARLKDQFVLPPEFIALRYTPEPWRPEDSLLVALGMFQTLNGQEQDERMLSVMTQALPAGLLAFLTPDSGPFTTTLSGGPESRRPARPLPSGDWQALLATSKTLAVADIEAGIDTEALIAGSNNWAVDGSRTRDGRAIVANDMHLSLGVPNIWYRAALRYAGRELTGLTLPGLPMLVVGSNGRIAWGFTNIDADLLDLVRLEINPDHPELYRTPEGWRPFEPRRESVSVKGGNSIQLSIKETIWGPVAETPLLEHPVAIRWTALDPAAVDLKLTEMDEVDTLEQAMALLNRTGAPPQNVALADARGHIAWTYMGRFPHRRGFDGSVSLNWGDGVVGWDGFIPPDELPRVVDPPSGFLATANNRTLGKDYPHVIGHNFSNGYRAWRISERLKSLQDATEAEMLDVQLDTRSEIFDFYRDLALSVLDEEALKEPLLREARGAISAWNGRMDADSSGIPLLVNYRRKLAEILFAPVIEHGRRLDSQFAYAWREMETPMRALLNESDPSNLPDTRHRNWRDLKQQVLLDAARDLSARFPDVPLERLTWGRVNRIVIRHPFARQLPPAVAEWLNMAAFDSPGCASFCVRVSGDPHGQTERMAVSPNHPEDGILHMPAGQSGNPFSPHYRDQQAAWQKGRPLPFLPGASRTELYLRPRED
ncbi:penicillin acylase family protein [Methylococcus sp. EFPC2]|uniref:penicillin acylase family protein n=1 Tax=Methylococcus sp. EFPC2 TaxID=2812648 RepID=UPI001967FFFB|nr:penicillin acylase family protein [Methylococcus sp. EFPC2]QSA96488.1 penicillin acylase family protein [Methylococcus sp. EFPC2]